MEEAQAALERIHHATASSSDKPPEPPKERIPACDTTSPQATLQAASAKPNPSNYRLPAMLPTPKSSCIATPV